MASYMEIKTLLGQIFAIQEMDESCDVFVPSPTYSDRKAKVCIPNERLKEAYELMISYHGDNLEMYTPHFREIAVQAPISFDRYQERISPMIDDVNKLKYTIGEASLEYCMFLLAQIADLSSNGDRTIQIDLRHRVSMLSRRGIDEEYLNNPLRILPELLRARTLRVDSEKIASIKYLREYAASCEFSLMYKNNFTISEHRDIHDMYPFAGSRTRKNGFGEYDNTPPRRIVNSDVMGYYTMAMQAKDPFTMYISFYHVIEHYFDAVFRKKLTDLMRDRITHPGFSYKSEESLYELAKQIRSQMNSNEEAGDGNEFESLKYVLWECVDIGELMQRINCLDATACQYYIDNLVPFVSNKKLKISWNDTEGVRTNLATRIYKTRNALVHNKSGQKDNQYEPYKDEGALIREIPLIRAVAESVIIHTSDLM